MSQYDAFKFALASWIAILVFVALARILFEAIFGALEQDVPEQIDKAFMICLKALAVWVAFIALAIYL